MTVKAGGLAAVSRMRSTMASLQLLQQALTTRKPCTGLLEARLVLFQGCAWSGAGGRGATADFGAAGTCSCYRPCCWRRLPGAPGSTPNSHTCRPLLSCHMLTSSTLLVCTC